MNKDANGHINQDQKVNKIGRGRVLHVTKFLPEGFEWVRVTRTRHDENNVWLHIRKLDLKEAL